MKSIFLALLLLLMNGSSHASENGVALGQSDYIYTHSRVANIISARNAETEALHKALLNIEIRCGGENFNLISVDFSDSFDPSSPLVGVVAEILFTCAYKELN